VPQRPSNDETPATRVLVGLVGRDILASRSPWLHEQEADAHGFRLVYSLLDFTARGWDDEQLPATLDAVQRVGFAGINVTYPFKQAVVALVDELADCARTVGAVNSLAFVGSRRVGYNTDVTGFQWGFATGLPDASLARVVQFGAGGGGAATAHALARLGTQHLTVFDPQPQRIDALLARLRAAFPDRQFDAGRDPAESLASADGLVNATPMGMAKSPQPPFPPSLLEARHWVADIVYFPLETQLLRAARSRGCRCLDGSGMVVNQAAEAFEIFTGRPADRTRMAASFLAFAARAPDVGQ
jgi:shikimate dehydrogenase